MNVLGIDPGKTGALAVISQSHKSAQVFSFDGLTETQLFNLITSNAMDPCRAFIERVGAMPGQGVTSMFTFGQGLGFLRCALLANQIPFEEVTPQVWQKALGLGGKFVSKTIRKTAHLGKAQQLFPGLSIKKPVADALLIAEYGHRVLFRSGNQ